MFKKKFAIFFLFLTQLVFSQTKIYSLVFKDEETNQVIEDVNVFILKSKQNFLSNAEGKVIISVLGSSNVQFTHSSYKAQTVRSLTLKIDEENIVYLKPITSNLDEIILTKQHPQKILKSLVENSIKNLSVPSRLKVYCREFFKLNNTYSYYNDGLMNFQISGKPNSFKTNILVEQNRSYGLIDEEVSQDLLGYNLNNIMENYYSFKYLEKVIDPKAKKEFDYIIKGYNGDDHYYVMTIIPLDNAPEMSEEFTIVYENTKKLIIDVSSKLSESMLAKSKDKTANGSKNIYKSFFKTRYKIEGSNYYLLYSREETGFEKIEKNRTKKVEVLNNFITTNFSLQKFSFDDSDVFKDKTLFNKSNKIITNYWETSGITSTDEEEAIIKTLELRP